MGGGVVPIDMAEIMPLLMQVADEKGNFDLNRLDPRNGLPLFPLWILKYLPNMVAAHISMAFNVRDPTAPSPRHAWPARRRSARLSPDRARRCRRLLAGGADSRIDPLLMLAYTALGTLSRAESSAGGGFPAL